MTWFQQFVAEQRAEVWSPPSPSKTQKRQIVTENRIRAPKLTTKKALFASYGEGAGA